MARTLVEILKEIKLHREMNPAHGTNCACMDNFSWEIAEQIQEAIPSFRTYDKPRIEDEALRSFAHILEMTKRKL